MSIWNLYRKPKDLEGEPVPGLPDARYFTGYESRPTMSTKDPMYLFTLGAVWSFGLITYLMCHRSEMKAQRLFSTLIMTAVPIVILCHKKGDDNRTGLVGPISLEERLDYYPVTRRALERAISDVSKN